MLQEATNGWTDPTIIVAIVSALATIIAVFIAAWVLKRDIRKENVDFGEWKGAVNADRAALKGFEEWKGAVDADRAALKGFGEWKGAVDTDRKSFKEFMKEVRDDLKEIRNDIGKIFVRIGPKVSEGQSPVRLSDLGSSISKEINALEWAVKVASAVQGQVKGLEAYEIQDFSFKYAENETHYSDQEQRDIRRSAYEKGVTEEQVRRVLGIELRDRLLELVLMDTP